MFSFAKKLVDRLDGTLPQTDSYFQNILLLNNNGHALRVLSVVPHSPAHQLGLESWFDYIVRINNHELPMQYPSTRSYSINDDGSINYGGESALEQASLINYDLLVQELRTIAASSNGAQSVILDVWSAKGGVLRQVTVPVSPFTADSSELDVHKLFVDNFQQIGLTVQSQHVNTATYVWRILNTHPDLPAFQAQLVPHFDYIIGCDSVYEEENGKGLLGRGGEALLSRTVVSYYNHHHAVSQEDSIPITLYVYNHDYDILRPVTVNLSRAWSSGAKGILGCDVGYGLLHRIPNVIGKFDSTYETVDDVLFENNANYGYNVDQQPVSDANTFVPAPIAAPPLASLAPPPKSAKKKKHHTSSGGAANLADYMNEELTKSKEEDVKYNTGGTEDVPPPPPPTKPTKE